MTQPERLEQVTIGKVTVRKKSLGKRFSETFLKGGDAKTVMSYVVIEVVIPAAKDLIVDAGQQFLERMVFGENRPGRTRTYGTTPYTPYNAFSKPAKAVIQQVQAAKTLSHQARSTHNFGEIVFTTRAEAEEVLNRLVARIDKYDQATVNDLYDLVGLTGDFPDERYGWTSLNGASTTRVRQDQYVLNLPPTIQLD